jgi:F420-non-reducing hydrogenase small subunit
VIYDEVFSLDDVVKVDYVIPACPPTREMNQQLLKVILDFLSGKAPLPPPGTILASTKTMCDECPRKRPDKVVIDEIHSLDYTIPDQEKCFLEQGILCLGPATRAGCDSKCMKINMPCRGCMGPTSAVIDHGASMLSAFTSIMKVSGSETQLPEEEIAVLMSKMKDPLGMFYRFTLPKSLLRKVVHEKHEEPKR